MRKTAAARPGRSNGESSRRVSRLLAVGALIVLASAPSSAFHIDVHADVTRAALTAFLDNLSRTVPNVRQQFSTAADTTVTGFTPAAANEIVNANVAQDTDDCGDKFDYFIPAKPCGNYVTDTAAAFYHLFKEPHFEHFDAESIQQASDYVYQSRTLVRTLLRQHNYVGARKVLGHALHALQDFYAHTNYVELGYRSPDIDTRIGASLGSFAVSSNKPRLAGPNDPTCLFDHSTVITDGLAAKVQQELNNTPTTSSKYVELQNDLSMLREYRSGHVLTSGYFYLDPIDDPDVVTDVSKCRHGWESPDLNQPGINKDRSYRPLFTEAHSLAVRHSIQFVIDVTTDALSDSQLTSDDRILGIVGLMGYEPSAVIEAFSVGVPGAPGGASWDTATGSALKFFIEGTKGLKNIQPDVLVCMQSKTVPNTCAALCEDADWNLDLNAYVCEQPIGPAGRGLLVEKDLRILVQEEDPIGGPGPLGKWVPNQVIANFRVDDPRACDPFCTVQLDSERSLWIRFKVTPVSRYSGPRRSQAVILPPAQTIPVAKPSGSGSSTSTTPSTTPSTALASSSTTGTAPANPTAFAPSRTTTAAALRTVDGIDQRLALRDLDNCTGADMFYPQPSATQTKQVWEMAAFSLAITDTATKQAVLSAIQARVGDDAFFSAMTDVIANPVQSQALLTAYQNTAKNISQQISSAGLTSLMPSPVPPSALPSYVDRWLASKLSSPALISNAVNMMAGSTSLTAECTINELAKQGFTDMVLAR